MFGYMRPNEPNLLVKEQKIYQAVYCGLCRTMRRNISLFASFSLNYDFVFLALLRAELVHETFGFCQKRCAAHPLKKRNCVSSNSPTLAFVAKVHLGLLYEKLRDDMRDSDVSFRRKLGVYLYYPFILFSVKRLLRRDNQFKVILDRISDSCKRLYQLEKDKSNNIDELAHVCAEGLSKACSIGLDDTQARLMDSATAGVGRLVYLIDACDDLEMDAKRGCFNPFLLKYGSLESAVAHLNEVNITLALYARDLDATVNLIVRPGFYAGICSNIARQGIPAVIRRVMEKYDGKNGVKN